MTCHTEERVAHAWNDTEGTLETRDSSDERSIQEETKETTWYGSSSTQGLQLERQHYKIHVPRRIDILSIKWHVKVPLHRREKSRRSAKQDWSGWSMETFDSCWKLAPRYVQDGDYTGLQIVLGVSRNHGCETVAWIMHTVAWRNSRTYDVLETWIKELLVLREHLQILRLQQELDGGDHEL